LEMKRIWEKTRENDGNRQNRSEEKKKREDQREENIIL
jgi:hypothetical protein